MPVCSSCQCENREGRRFCVDCGRPLAQPCPACGAGYEPGERFCGECGASLTSLGSERPLPDVKGRLGTIRAGARRAGGSLNARMCRCTVWSSYFHAAGYQAKRFDDFLSA